MSGNSVEIKIGGDDADLLRAWQRQIKALDKLDSKMNRLGRSGGKSAQKVKGGFDSALGTLGKFTAAITGIGGVVGGISIAARQLFVEFQRIKDLQQTDVSKQIEFEKSLVNAIRNAGDFFTGKEIKDTTLKLSAETGVAPKIIADVISSTLSKRGAVNKEQALEAISGTQAALKFAPELDAEGAAILAGSSVNISKKTGYTPEEAVGLAQNVSALASITKPELIAKNVTPALNALLEFKNSPQEAGSLIAAITQGSEDSTGERSRTAAIQLAKQIEERGIGGSTAEGLRMLQQDPELRNRFFEGGEFNGKKFPGVSVEAAAYTTVKQLTDAGSDLAKSFIAGIDQVGGRAEALARYDKTVAQVKSVTPSSRQAREAAAAADIANIQDVAGGRAANVRNTLASAFDAANISDYRKKILMGRFEVGSTAGQEDPEQVALEIIRRERKRLESTVDNSGNGGLGPIIPLERQVSDQDRFSANQLKNFEKIISDAANENQPQPEEKPKVKEEAEKAALFMVPPERFENGGKKKKFKYGNTGDYLKRRDGTILNLDEIPREEIHQDNPAMAGQIYTPHGYPTTVFGARARREKEADKQIRLQMQQLAQTPAQNVSTDNSGGLFGLMQQQVSVFNQILEEQKRQGRGPITPARPAPYRVPAERLNRGAG